MQQTVDKLSAIGYKFQFITLAGFHALNFSLFNLARGYKERGMSTYTDLPLLYGGTAIQTTLEGFGWAGVDEPAPFKLVRPRL